MSVSNQFQVKAMADLVDHYGWTRLAIIASADDYGK